MISHTKPQLHVSSIRVLRYNLELYVRPQYSLLYGELPSGKVPVLVIDLNMKLYACA